MIITEIDQKTGTAVCVNVTSSYSHSDRTCILNVGDHAFIRHESVINFSDARQILIEHVERALSSQTSKFVCVAHQSCSDALLARIRDGLLQSRQTPKGIKEFCRKLWDLNKKAST